MLGADKKPFIDFLAVRTNVTYVARLKQHSGAMFGYPTDGSPLFDAEEWTPCIRVVVEACGRFICIELGADWGPWLVATAAAARQRGIKLAGLKLRTATSSSWCSISGITVSHPDALFLFRGVIGTPV
jgi:hypothetical protein